MRRGPLTLVTGAETRACPQWPYYTHWQHMRTCIKLLHPQLHHVRHTISRWYHKESFTHTLTLTTSLQNKRTKHTEQKALSIIDSDQTKMENARLPAQTNRISSSTSFLARRTTSRRNARGATHLVLPLLPIAAALRTMDGAHDLTKVCPRYRTGDDIAVTAKRRSGQAQ